MRMDPKITLAAVGAFLVSVTVASAQGVLIDIRPTIPIRDSFEVKEVDIDARVRDQTAEVRVSQTFHNPGSVQIEAKFVFPIPEDGAVGDFVLMVDGRELPGKLMDKDEARKIYEEIVRTKRDPALLEYMGRGLYQTSVFPIPPGADRKVTLRYTQLCRRDRDVIEFSHPLSTQKFASKPVKRLTIQATIQSKDAIKSVYCPSDDARIDREGNREARVRLERSNITPTNDFRVLYTLAEGALGASVLSHWPDDGEDGYFLMLASPEVKPPDSKPMPKTVVFALDRSGSMAGKKIEQARGALKAVLNNLRDDDLFNIVVYDDRVETFKPELQRYDSETREAASRFVDNIREGGSTNIDAALASALDMIQDDSRPNYVLFLTDGLPTVGETNDAKIADNCRERNKQGARIFSFGVGFDVNARLLDRLSAGNGGTSVYVKPDEDIETQVARFYEKMSKPVLANLRVEFSGTDVNRTYPRDLPDLFEGGQIVWVGRYTRSGPTKLKIKGKVAGESRSFEFPTELARRGEGSSHAFVDRLWAARRVGHLLDQIDLEGQNKELIEELVKLSAKYGLMTPYTSFLADEGVSLRVTDQNVDRARRSLQSLDVLSGQVGVAQREFKQMYQQAPRASAPALAEAAQARGLGGGMAGMGQAPMTSQAQGSGLVDMGRRQPGVAAKAQTAPAEKPKLRVIGSKTFYFKEGRWLDASVEPEEETKAKVVRRFSDEFFDLARSQSADWNQYLTFDEPVTVKLRGQVYRIEAAEERP